MPRLEIRDADPRWPVEFARLKARYEGVLSGLEVEVQHVGSTSVPGLAAKPVLDIDVIVPDADTSAGAICRLRALGYRHLGDLGIPGREALRQEDEAAIPESGDPPMRHNLYVVLRGSTALRNHLALRDRLRADPGLRREYAALKHRLAAEHPDDIDAYCARKTEFITHVLASCGVSRADLDAIREQNRR